VIWKATSRYVNEDRLKWTPLSEATESIAQNLRSNGVLESGRLIEVGNREEKSYERHDSCNPELWSEQVASFPPRPVWNSTHRNLALIQRGIHSVVGDHFCPERELIIEIE
jgi:hypothetical protein